MKPLFCRCCKKIINIPKFLLKGKINAPNGIKLGCGDKKCKGGYAMYFPPKPEITEDVNTTPEASNTPNQQPE